MPVMSWLFMSLEDLSAFSTSAEELRGRNTPPSAVMAGFYGNGSLIEEEEDCMKILQGHDSVIGFGK